jgi:cysteine-rich repeat protein
MDHREASGRDRRSTGLLSLVGATAMAVVGSLAVGTPAHAVTEAVLGKKVNIANPNSTARSFLGLGKETGTTYNAGVGGLPGPGNDPITSGAVLTVTTLGTSGVQETFNLPGVAFVDANNPGWKATATGYMYKDPKSIFGPVKVVVIKKTPGDVLMVKAKIVGTDPGTGPLDIDVAPPNTGTEASMTLTINNGDTFCVRMGGPAAGEEKKDDALKFLVVSTVPIPMVEAGCAPVCGNDAVEGTEECDDGNLIEADGCTSACTICGNNVVAGPEVCDDGNLISGDGCDANCTPTACGNGIVAGSETCDDGNTINADNCPSDCIIDGCTPDFGSDRTIDVEVTSGDLVAGLTVFIDYPEGDVRIPGSGGGIPAGTVDNAPFGAFVAANDLDHALRVAVANAGPIADGLLFNVHYEDCLPLSVPTPGDFTCTVEAASDASSAPLPGVTCAVTAVTP